jgi:hypothetical protein
MQKAEQEFRSIFSRNMENQFRKRVTMDSTPDDDIIFVEGDNTVLVYSLTTKEVSFIPVPGALSSVINSGYSSLHFLPSVEEEKTVVPTYNSELKAVVGTFSIPGRSFLRTLDKSLFLGFNRKLVRIDIQYR